MGRESKLSKHINYIVALTFRCYSSLQNFHYWRLGATERQKKENFPQGNKALRKFTFSEGFWPLSRFDCYQVIAAATQKRERIAMISPVVRSRSTKIQRRLTMY